MQAALTVMEHILPQSHFPTFLGFMNSLGNKMLPQQINNSVTRNRVLQCSANAKPVFLCWGMRERGRITQKKEKKLTKITYTLYLILCTCFFGELCEGLHSLLAIAALRGDGGDVSPAQGPDDVHHGLGLERVRRNHPREEIIALVVAQLWGCRSIADLGDLKEKETRWGLEQSWRYLNSWAGLNRVWNHKVTAHSGYSDPSGIPFC